MIIYRSGVQIYDVSIDDSTILTKGLMGVDIIKSTFESSVLLDIRTLDYITFKGLNYTVNQLPVVTKVSTRLYKYDVSFEGYSYAISESAFLNNSRADFSLYTGIDTMLIAIRDNLNRLGETAWTIVNSVTTTEFKNIAFANDSCLSALQKIVKEFLVEYYLVGHEIRVVDKVGNPTGLSFEYKAGLKEITRINANRNNIITSLWAYGGTQNIPATYRNGLQRLGLANPVQNNVATYGYKEGSINYEDIYPQRTGTVTSVNGLMFTDTSMDFDVNAYFVPKVTAKIIFKTGALVGYLFDLHSYDPGTKTFQIITYNDPAGFSLPNKSQAIAPGDQYTMVDIYMPQAYIDQAEADLLAKATEEIALLSTPRVTYKITPDSRHFKHNEITLECGDSLTVNDVDLASSGLTSRIIQLEQKVIDPFSYVITVSDTITYSVIQQVISEQRNTNNIIKIAGIENAWRARANWMNTQELLHKIFDPDGYFDNTNIRPLTIETGMISVGFKGSQFILKDVTFQPNFEGNYNALHISTGSLIHFTIDPNGVKTWAIGEYTTYALADATGYYLYVRANKTLNTADWFVSTNQYMTDTAGDYYYFLVGYLHEPNEGLGFKRGISLTYGSSTITGQFIQTGRISSTDGQTYFDLDTGVIHGTIEFESSQADAQVKSVIDGGLISTGRIEVGTGFIGQGQAGMTGDGTAGSSVRFWSGANFANRNTAPFRVLQDGTIVSTLGVIGGWHIAPDALYTQNKSLAPGLNPAPGVTFGSDGSIHAPTFYMNSDGVSGFSAIQKINLIPVQSGSFRGSVNMEGNEIWEDTQDNDVYGVIRINYYGYHKGSTRARITIIGSGQGSSVGVFSGIDNPTYGLHAGLDIRFGALKVPVLTTAQRQALSSAPGKIVFDSTLGQFVGLNADGQWWTFWMHNQV